MVFAPRSAACVQSIFADVRPNRSSQSDIIFGRAAEPRRAFSRGSAGCGLGGVAPMLARSAPSSLATRETASHSPDCAPALRRTIPIYCGVCTESCVQFRSFDAVSATRSPCRSTRPQPALPRAARRVCAGARAGRRLIRRERVPPGAGIAVFRLQGHQENPGEQVTYRQHRWSRRTDQSRPSICPGVTSDQRSKWRPAEIARRRSASGSAMPVRFFARSGAEDEEQNDDRENHVESGDGHVPHLSSLMLFRKSSPATTATLRTGSASP